MIDDLGIISLLCNYDWELFGVSLFASVHTYVSRHPQLLCGYAVDNTSFHGQSVVVPWTQHRQWAVHCAALKAEETTKLRTKAIWKKGPPTEPQTRDLRCVAEIKPRELRNRSCSFIPHCPLCASHGCAASRLLRTCDLEAGTCVEDSQPASLRWMSLVYV